MDLLRFDDIFDTKEKTFEIYTKELTAKVRRAVEKSEQPFLSAKTDAEIANDFYSSYRVRVMQEDTTRKITSSRNEDRVTLKFPVKVEQVELVNDVLNYRPNEWTKEKQAVFKSFVSVKINPLHKTLDIITSLDHAQEAVAGIREWLSLLQKEVEASNAELKNQLPSMVKDRRKIVEELQTRYKKTLQDLGIEPN